MRPLLALSLSLLTASAFAADGDWKTVATGAVVVKTRAVPHSAVSEIWAEGDMDAPVQDIQSALMDPDSYAKFMPYVKESRTFGKPEADGGQYVYTRLDFGALVTSRDYVVKVYLVQGVAPDGSGEFKNRWVADANRLPRRANSIRLTKNEGSWTATPKSPRKSHVVYRFLVDPAGWIPGFVADIGNKKGVTETFQAVEKEAQRRAKARQAAGEEETVLAPAPR